MGRREQSFFFISAGLNWLDSALYIIGTNVPIILYAWDVSPAKSVLLYVQTLAVAMFQNWPNN